MTNAVSRTKNLDSLFEEVKAGFSEYENKLSNLDEQIKDNESLKSAAKASHDVEEYSSITSKLDSLKEIRKQVEKDFEEHKEKMLYGSGNKNEATNGTGKDCRLNDRVRLAYRKDKQEDNDDETVQGIFEEIDSLKNQMLVQRNLLKRKEEEARRLFSRSVERFRDFYPHDERHNISTPRGKQHYRQRTGQ